MRGMSINSAREDAASSMNLFQNWLFPKGLVQTIMDDKATWGKAKKGDRGGIPSSIPKSYGDDGGRLGLRDVVRTDTLRRVVGWRQANSPNYAYSLA